jgi:outer membrane lipoprotein
VGTKKPFRRTLSLLNEFIRLCCRPEKKLFISVIRVIKILLHKNYIEEPHAMIFKNFVKSTFLIVLILALSGCAAPISKNLRGLADPGLTFEQVRQAPDKYKSEIVVWGGEIIKTVNEKNGTRLEILQKTLNFELMPKYGDHSGGRFMALYNGYLDSAIYEKGRQITLAGEIIGKMTARVGEIDYIYPMINVEEIYLWRDRRREYYPYPHPYPYPYYHGWRYGFHWYYH